MASEPPPGSPPPPAPPPPPGSSRQEWREWRRQDRRSYWDRPFWGGNWAWFWGVVLILVGGYALLRTLGLLNWIRADIFWPLILIALGIWLIVQRAAPRRPPR